MDSFWLSVIGSLDAIGAIGAVVGFGGGIAWLISTGRWVPRKTHEDVQHDKDEWRTESRIKDQQIKELSDQNQILLNQIGPTLTKFLNDMREHAEETSRRDVS